MAERYDAGIVTAYGAAVRGGYTGTYDEFCAQQAGYAQSAAAVAQAKTDAEAAAQTAQDVADSIPADYTQLSEDVSSLKEDKADIDSVYVTDTASGSIASFPDGADDVPVKSLKVQIEPVQSGTGDPSPDNVRPISGWTQAVVTRTGKNLFDNSRTPRLIDCYDANGVAQIRKGYYEYLPSGTYTISATLLQNSAYIYINVINKDGTYASFKYLCAGTRITNATITLSEGQYLAVYDSQSDADATPDKFGYLQIQIELGSTVTAYEPYTAQTVTVDLGDTVYGGTLDVGTGVLTVDRAIYTISNGAEGINVSALTVARLAYNIPSDSITWTTHDTPSNNLICNEFPETYNQGTVFGGLGIHYRADGSHQVVVGFGSFGDLVADIDEARAWVTAHPIVIVYGLAVPVTYQLTPTEVRTLLAQNNVFADCGNTTVEYRADTKLYIEKLTAPTEDDLIADHAIAANSFFMIGNTLYRATTAIASGATITVGTNATKLSLSDALNALA